MHDIPPSPEELDRQRGTLATLIGARGNGERVTVDFDVFYSGPLRLSLERGDWARLLGALLVATSPSNAEGNAPRTQIQQLKRRGLFPALRSILFGDPETPNEALAGASAARPDTETPDRSNEALDRPFKIKPSDLCATEQRRCAATELSSLPLASMPATTPDTELASERVEEPSHASRETHQENF